ncbi:DgyrCDS14839 [Dimorphilus gyrociliatus]|uniref:DgyrCDS14839 n=1 Tax=Dimorphilus gyrociliatus TaxID=2664684 RepID=A0A7I8WFD0_9ANNE|nr:DgyrCDS14839 [Dimorphilus gyrociliatus]
MITLLSFLLISLTFDLCQLRHQFLFKDDETVLLYDWYNVNKNELIPANSVIPDIGGLGKVGTIFGNTVKYNTDGSIYFGLNDYLKVMHDLGFGTGNQAFSVEIVCKYILPADYSDNLILYSFSKFGYLAPKISLNGNGSLGTTSGVKNGLVMKPLTDDYLTYFAFVFDQTINRLFYYMNGVQYGYFTVGGIGSDSPINLGLCLAACNSKDFHGNVYAFKWSNSFKSETDIKNTWDNSLYSFLSCLYKTFINHLKPF